MKMGGTVNGTLNSRKRLNFLDKSKDLNKIDWYFQNLTYSLTFQTWTLLSIKAYQNTART